MSKNEKIIIFALRLALGWVFFYAGLSKILDPRWSAEMFLKGAKTFNPLYQFFTQPNLLPTVNFLNEWGLTLLGVSLILGVGVRLSSILGILLMILYYFPQLNFPYVGRNSYLIDQHVIFILLLVYFYLIRAGRVWGLENWCSNLPICRKILHLRSWFG